MEMIYYTIAAVVLYLVSDYILNTIEYKMGKRLPNRSFVFLIIITILALTSFSLIRALVAPLPNKSMPTTKTEQPASQPVITQPASNQAETIQPAAPASKDTNK